MKVRTLRLLAALALLAGLAACATPDSLQPSTELGAQRLQVPRPTPSPALAPTVGQQAFAPKTPRLPTRWSAQVSTTMPLPDYPRPQLVRSQWLNLNGQWQFGNAAAGQAPPVGQTLAETVLVPFPAESALSGIQRHQERMWYRRVFRVPDSWRGKRVRLNFGAVDQQATVWVNGAEVGYHSGGYDAFSLDITGQLRAGDNELIVGVFDPTNAGDQPVGKQVNVPDNGIFYTASSGIWQTVWLEPVEHVHLTRLDLTPDVPGQALRVQVRGENLAGQTVRVTALRGATVVGQTSGSAGQELRVPVPNPRLWSPDDPFLYDLIVTVGRGRAADTVGSYFGMRSVEKVLVNGVARPLLNGEFVFHLGTLDQGYWPDGLYTAPTDAALKFDLEAHKELGFNMVRKHIKVEPQRWFYWADKLGLLVWQDMPSMPLGKTPSLAAREQSERELRAMIDQHRSSPAVVVWVSQNEGWGQYDQARVADLIRAYDPSRLVNNMSGINCCGSVDGGNGDLADWHVYVGPSSPTAEVSRGRIRALGEFGGLGLKVPGHEWNPGTSFSYELQPSREALNTRYLGLVAVTKSLMINRGLSASVYTEITDVESEINGFYTYDREVNKLDTARVRAAHEDLIAASNEPPAGNVSLPLNVYRSFRVTTPGFTDRFMSHAFGLGITEAVNAGSSQILKEDATWRIVPGLADASCYSLESRNFPGEYLRHAASRVRREPRGGVLFDQDATWCARPGILAGQISLESLNFPGLYLRHYAAELWLAREGGPLPSDTPSSFPQDTSWDVVDAWAP